MRLDSSSKHGKELADAGGSSRTRFAAVCRVLVWISCAIVGSTQTASAKDTPPPEWDFIAFETKSWGVPLTSWRLAPGGGSWTEAVRKQGAMLHEYSLVWHEIEANPQHIAVIERILKALPVPAPDSAKCENMMFDLPYGTIRLTKGATTTEIAWNSGCMDGSYKPLLDTLKAADEQVRSWGKSGKVLRTEPGSVN